MIEYINREEFLKRIKPYNTSDNMDKALYYFALRKMVETPTADVKPMVHAHWIEGQTDNPNIHNILCSHCFEGYPSKGHANSQYTKKRFQWCPHCGAKMEENERTLKYADEKYNDASNIERIWRVNNERIH